MLQKFLIKMQLKDAKSFLQNLKVMDGSELGLVVALATHYRNDWLDKGTDVSRPIQLQATDPMFVTAIISEIKKLQNNNMQHLVPGLMVWVHSLRAGNDLKLRGVVRQIWGELERGFAHVVNAREDALSFIPIPLDIVGYEEFPDGLTPNPI